MVKFGRHLQFFLELEGLDEDKNHTIHDIERNASFHNYDTKSSTNSHYIVPYNILRDAIESSSSPPPPPPTTTTTISSTPTKTKTTDAIISNFTPASFEMKWRDSLKKATLDLSESMNTCWKYIFDSISSHQHQYHHQQQQDQKENKLTLPPSTRGMELMDAIQVYTQINDIVSSRDLLCFLKDTYNAAEINYQALRKIVKKFDKKYYTIRKISCNGSATSSRLHHHHHYNQHYMNSYQDGEGMSHAHSNGITGEEGSKDLLSNFLLPELYSSFLFVGRGMLEMTISYLRELIEEITSTTSGEDVESETQSNSVRTNDDIVLSSPMKEIIQLDDEDKHENKVPTLKENNDKNNQAPPIRQVLTQHGNERHEGEEEIVMKRADEMQWLNNIVKNIPQSELRHIVAHRGFHTPQGRSDFRPLENSLSAFESAWSAGIHLCECDIAMTKDEKLVLAHDEDFNRLALDKSSRSSKVKVSELTFKELIALTLKNGVRAPLLKDVLMSANAIGPEAKLIIEIKPGNSETGMALARLLVKYPELISHVAVIMSFDLWSMHSLSAELQKVFPNLPDGYANDIDHMRLAKSEYLYGTSPSAHSFMHNTVIERSRSNSLVSYHSTPSKVILPKLMLLTVAEQPANKFELCVDVSDYSPIDGWLHSSYTSLDGVYVRCQPEMFMQEGRESLRQLSRKYTVGVWGKVGEDPDDYQTMHYLVKECGVSFYNTDLPRTFRANL